jgi:cytochrome c-type biogenesis protein CcmH/NrfG
MSNPKHPLQSTDNRLNPTWTSVQAYVLAAFCLFLGVALGYLFRGSASPAVAAATPAAAQAESNPHAQAQSADMQAALAQAAAPLLQAINKDPNDYDSLVKLGNLFYDGQQFANAIQYYVRAVAIHPENADVRTDLGTAYWYAGNADKAITEMETSLKYRPGHPQTLFNLGWVRWQAKGDPKGAVTAWEQLLKANPDYPQKQQVEQYIAKAKEHASRG